MSGSLRPFFVFWVLLLVPLVSVSADFGDPGGFLENETITETPLYPGVTWLQVNGRHLGYLQVTHVVTVDISQPHLTMKALTGQRLVNHASGQFFRRSTMSQMQRDNDALVAINTSFFDISNTMAPGGLLLRDRMLLREPAGRNVFAFTEKGKPAIGNYGFQGTIRFGTSGIPFVGMNRNTLANGQMSVYQQPWDASPGNGANFVSGLEVNEVLLEKIEFIPSSAPSVPAKMRGRVIQVRKNMPSVAIPSNGFVITGVGSARWALESMQIDSIVDVEWRLSGGIAGIDWNEITHATAGSSLLIVNGQVQSQNTSHWNARHPRSAIGISADGSRLLLLLVEGRQTGRAEGMSLHSVGQYLKHMEAYNGLEFDGGGSSALAGRLNGNNQLLSRPSDGSERYVPAGLGVHLVPEPEHPLFKNIRVSSGAGGAVISWETEEPATSYVRYGQADLDHTTVPPQEPRTRHTALLTGLDAPGAYFARLAIPSRRTEDLSQLIPIPPMATQEIIVDDPAATFTGTWDSGAYRTPWGSSYRHTTTVTRRVTHSAEFQPIIRATGLYDVHTWYTQGTNRTTDARYQVRHEGGIENVSVDQTRDGERWRLLASDLLLRSGGDYPVAILNTSSQAGDVVIADAVRWTLKTPLTHEPGTAPPWWMEHFFGEDPPASSVDSDGDGVTAFEEYLWGTDPTDPESRASVQLERGLGESWTFTFWPFRDDRVYQLQGRIDLADGEWQDLAAPPPVRLSNGAGRVALPSPEAMERAFYRVRVSEP